MKRKPYLQGLPRFVLRDTSDKMLFGFVRGYLASNSDASVTTAIKAFIESFSIQEADVRVAKSSYYRTLGQFLEQPNICSYENEENNLNEIHGKSTRNSH